MSYLASPAWQPGGSHVGESLEAGERRVVLSNSRAGVDLNLFPHGVPALLCCSAHALLS